MNCQSKVLEHKPTEQEQINELRAGLDSLKNAKLSGEVVLGATKDTVQAFLPFDPQKVLADSLKWANQADSIQTLGNALVWREKQAYKRHLYNFNQLNKRGYETSQKLQNIVDSLSSLGVKYDVVFIFESPQERPAKDTAKY